MNLFFSKIIFARSEATSVSHPFVFGCSPHHHAQYQTAQKFKRLTFAMHCCVVGTFLGKIYQKLIKV